MRAQCTRNAARGAHLRVAQVVDDAPRGCDDDLGPLAQRRRLRRHREAADDQCGANVGELRELGDHGVDLGLELGLGLGLDD